ncbi:hypothetical protein QVD17_37866 [Tagetes erecta]|uniref:EGF-like domain-containing protein n=1 Tax=Tagetes erecta TaxID=13708 RepID=A0AAD8NKF1_TARER|nr:hypothetical protein QVD17_37866 [Tagetes erecta]
MNNTAKPGCATQCGNITVPYPFGIGTNCSHSLSFNLTCNTSYEPPKLFLENVIIYSITDLELRIFTTFSYNCYDQNGLVDSYLSWNDFRGLNEFTFSEKNKFTVIGCDDYAWITGTEEDDFTSGCFGLCRKAPETTNGQCSGIGCCQISIRKGLSNYNITLFTLKSHSGVLSFNRCGFGFLVEERMFKFEGVRDLSSNYLDFMERIESTMPVVLDWVIKPFENCTTEVNVCKGQSSCYDVDGGGYRCRCNQGYEGNPYLHPGCQGTSVSPVIN